MDANAAVTRIKVSEISSSPAAGSSNLRVDITRSPKSEDAEKTTSAQVDASHSGDLEVTETQSDPATPSLQGTWKGSVSQPGHDEYSLTMTLQAMEKGKIVGSIDYPTLSCGGQLTLVHIENDTYVLKESIQRGLDSCVSGGSIELKLDEDGALAWRWFYPNGEQGASATLTQEVAERLAESSSKDEGTGTQAEPAESEPQVAERPPITAETEQVQSDDLSVLVEAVGPWAGVLGKSPSAARAFADQLGYQASSMECVYTIDNDERSGDLRFGGDYGDCPPEDVPIIRATFDGTVLNREIDPPSEVARMAAIIGFEPLCDSLDAEFALWNDPPELPNVAQLLIIGMGSSHGNLESLHRIQITMREGWSESTVCEELGPN